MILNKIDLLPYVPFQPELARENARRIHPEIEIIETSCTTGAGFDQWLNWLAARAAQEGFGFVPRRFKSMLTQEVGNARIRRSWRACSAQRHHAPPVGEILQRHAGHAGAARALSGADRRAVSKAKKPVLVWLQFQDCTGCSESMLRSSHPDVADVVLDLLSWEYHEVIMAGAGDQPTRCSTASSRRKRQVSGGGGRRDSDRRMAASTAPSAAARARHRRTQRSAATPPPPSPWAPAPSTAAWCARQTESHRRAGRA
jgi:hypothetical protein